MKLLFDENLSDQIVREIADFFPGSTHVKQENLLHTDDQVIWNFAARNGFALVSKDSDFHQRSLLFGAPPKFIYLKCGNCSTRRIVQLLKKNVSDIVAFDSISSGSILILAED